MNVGLLIILATIVYCTCAQDIGFEYLFADNDLETEDLPLEFEDPQYKLPNWIRNGFGRFQVGRRRVLHIFDAFGKLTKFNFTSQGVLFSTKFIRSNLFNDSLIRDDIAPYLFFDGMDPEFTRIQKIDALLRGVDNMNINLHRFTEDFVVVNDFWRVYTFDPKNLNVIQRFTPNVPGFGVLNNFLSLISSAHPLPEVGTTNHVNFATTVQVGPTNFGHSVISFCRLKNAVSRDLIARWKLTRTPYMHSFGASSNHTALFVGPVFVDVLRLLFTANPVRSLEWHEDETEVYVTEIKTGKVNVSKHKTGFLMHHINGFEQNGHLIMDSVTYPSIEFIRSLHVDVLRNRTARNAQIPSTSTLNRYVINLATMKMNVQEHNVSKGYEFVNRLDLPVINENFRFRTYCYVYGNVIKSDGVNVANVTLVKKDLCNKGGDSVWYEVNNYPSEAWFIPRPGGTGEDDGLLISIVLDGKKRTSFLLLVDPRNMRTIAKAYLPTFVPYSIHGRFFKPHESDRL